MDRLMKINNEVYKFQLEMNYWSTYHSNLIDFLLYNTNKLKKKNIKKIHLELIDVQNHILKLEKKIEKKLKKTHYFESEKYYNFIQKQYYETQTNDTETNSDK